MHYSKRIKTRIRILVFVSCLTVALVFGLSYYFGLIATETAITSKVPELEGLAGKFKSTLLVNTVIFAGVIIASFFALAYLLTERMFKPLHSLQADIELLARGTVPGRSSDPDHGLFGTLVISFESACERIEKHSRSLIEDLEKAVELDCTKGECAAKLNEIIEKSKQFIGDSKPVTGAKSDAEADDSVFMQPV
jgi:methyl-accepting chemotaxis protein